MLKHRARTQPIWVCAAWSLVSAVVCAACLPASGTALPSNGAKMVEEGTASYYGDQFEGRSTANGERFRQSERTAAHRTFPFGTIVRVTNLKTGLSTTVRINDRGPFRDARVIDLSRAAAEEIGMVADGLAQVRLEVLDWGTAQK